MINNFYSAGYSQMNPNQYAQMYAKQNNMSVDSAKAHLESIYGKPQMPQQNSTSTQDKYSNMDMFEKMELLNQYYSNMQAPQGPQASNGTEGSQGFNSSPNSSKPSFFSNLFNRAPQGLGQNQNMAPQGPQALQGQELEPNENSNFFAPNSFSLTSKTEENNFFAQGQDPDEFAKEYMEKHNEENPNDQITLDEAKEILEEQYGSPEQRQ